MIFYLPIFLVPLQILVVQLGYLVHKAEMDEKFAFPNVTQISKVDTVSFSDVTQISKVDTVSFSDDDQIAKVDTVTFSDAGA